MKVFAHQLEYYEMLLLCFTRVHANTYTEMGKKTVKDTEMIHTNNQRQFSQSNSGIMVICLSLPQCHGLRLEHINQAKWTSAKRAVGGGGYMCMHLGRTDSNPPPSLIQMITITSLRVLARVKEGAGRHFLF